jgi:hypothetical protein
MNFYVVLAIAFATCGVIGGAYLKGRSDGVATVKAAQLETYEKAVQDSIKEMGLRAIADQVARLDAERFSTQVRKNLSKVREDFHALPQVVVKNDGCPDLSDSFRMRWNDAERAASDIRSAASSGESVRDDAVPAAE